MVFNPRLGVFRWEHRVDKVLGFFFSRPIGTPPPLPAGECVHPFGYGWGVTLACGRGGVGGPNWIGVKVEIM